MVSKLFLQAHLRNDHDIDKPLLTLNQSEMCSAASPIVIQKEWGCGGTVTHFLQRFCISDKNEDSLEKKITICSTYTQFLVYLQYGKRSAKNIVITLVSMTVNIV